MPAEFTIPMEHTYLDYVELNRATWRTLISRVLMAVGGIGLIVGAFAKVQHPPVLHVDFHRIIWGLVLITLCVAVPWLAALPPWRRERAHASCTFHVTEEHIEIASDDSSIRYAWADFSHFTETRNLIVLWHPSPAVVLAVTKRALREGKVAELFQQVVDTKLARARRVRIGR